MSAGLFTTGHSTELATADHVCGSGLDAWSLMTTSTGLVTVDHVNESSHYWSHLRNWSLLITSTGRATNGLVY